MRGTCSRAHHSMNERRMLTQPVVDLGGVTAQPLPRRNRNEPVGRDAKYVDDEIHSLRPPSQDLRGGSTPLDRWPVMQQNAGIAPNAGCPFTDMGCPRKTLEEVRGSVEFHLVCKQED